MIRLGSFDLLGRVVSVRASTRLAEPLASALAGLSCRAARRAPLLTVERFANGDWSVAWRHEQRYRGPDEGVAFYDVLGAFNDVAARHVAADGRVCLHGGSVDVVGRVLSLVGHSGAGKSTLTAALVQAGHGFVADEVTAIADPSGGDLTVSSFHRPIGLRSDGAVLLGIGVPPGPFEHTFPLDANIDRIARRTVSLADDCVRRTRHHRRTGDRGDQSGVGAAPPVEPDARHMGPRERDLPPTRDDREARRLRGPSIRLDRRWSCAR